MNERTPDPDLLVDLPVSQTQRSTDRPTRRARRLRSMTNEVEVLVSLLRVRPHTDRPLNRCPTSVRRAHARVADPLKSTLFLTARIGVRVVEMKKIKKKLSKRLSGLSEIKKYVLVAVQLTVHVLTK